MPFRPKSIRLPADVDLASREGVQAVQDRLRRLAADDQRVAASAAGVLSGTHKARLGLAVAQQRANTEFYETDRGIRYLVKQQAGGALAWAYESGMYRDVYANRPGALNLADAGYLFLATDVYQIYRWSGSAWAAVSDSHPLVTGTYAQRTAGGVFAPANYPAGTLFFETDRLVTYRSDGSAWRYHTGTLRGLASAIAALTTGANPLGLTDTGLLYFTTDYRHLSRWNGTAWEWGDGEKGGGYFVPCAALRTDPGWHLCDGSVVAAQVAPGGATASYTLPNLYVAYPAPMVGAGNAYDPSVRTADGVSAAPGTPGNVQYNFLTGTFGAANTTTVQIPDPAHTHGNQSYGPARVALIWYFVQ